MGIDAFQTGSTVGFGVLAAFIVGSGVGTDGVVKLCFGVLDGNIAGSKIGFVGNQIALSLVETGQLGITGTVFIIHQITLLGGKVADLLVEAGLLDILDVVGISSTDFTYNSKPLSGNIVISSGNICLILPHGVVTCKTVEKGPVNAESVADGRHIFVIVGSVVIPVTVGRSGSTESQIEEGIDGGGVGTVFLIEIVTGDFELGTVRLEVRTVGKSSIKINLNSGQLVEIQIKVDGEFDVGGQSPFGIAHEHSQSVKCGVIVVVGSDHIAVGAVHLDLKVEHIAQRNSTCLEFVVGIFQRDLLELSVFLCDAALGNGEKHVVVSLSHGVHHLAAVVSVHGLLVFDPVFLSHDVELSGKTVKDHPVDAEPQIC